MRSVQLLIKVISDIKKSSFALLRVPLASFKPPNYIWCLVWFFLAEGNKLLFSPLSSHLFLKNYNPNRNTTDQSQNNISFSQHWVYAVNIKCFFVIAVFKCCFNIMCLLGKTPCHNQDETGVRAENIQNDSCLHSKPQVVAAGILSGSSSCHELLVICEFVDKSCRPWMAVTVYQSQVIVLSLSIINGLQFTILMGCLATLEQALKPRSHPSYEHSTWI